MTTTADDRRNDVVVDGTKTTNDDDKDGDDPTTALASANKFMIIDVAFVWLSSSKVEIQFGQAHGATFSTRVFLQNHAHSPHSTPP